MILFFNTYVIGHKFPHSSFQSQFLSLFVWVPEMIRLVHLLIIDGLVFIRLLHYHTQDIYQFEEEKRLKYCDCKSIPCVPVWQHLICWQIRKLVKPTQEIYWIRTTFHQHKKKLYDLCLCSLSHGHTLLPSWFSSWKIYAKLEFEVAMVDKFWRLSVDFLVILGNIKRILFVECLWSNDCTEKNKMVKTVPLGTFPAKNITLWTDAGLMLGQRRRRWLNITPALVQHLSGFHRCANVIDIGPALHRCCIDAGYPKDVSSELESAW